MALSATPGEQPIHLMTMLAGADLSAYTHRLVGINSSGEMIAPAAAGNFCPGVLQEGVASAAVGAVMVTGVTKCVAGSGGVTSGDFIKAGTDGKALVAVKGRTDTSDAGVAADALIGSYVVGVALSTAAENEKFTLLLCHLGAVPTTAA